MIVSARVPAMVLRLKPAVLWSPNRLGVNEGVVDDRDPSTDEQQTFHLDVRYPDAHHKLNPRLPVVTWLAAIPHRFVRLVLHVRAFIAAAIRAWFATRLSGRYPLAIFGYVEGAIRWHNRAVGYASILAIDEYPPFLLGP